MRYICLLCNRQFVAGSQRKPVADRPVCPECGKPMHVYMKTDNGMTRFRCSNYPVCRTFVKKQIEED
jgi:ssDNA-binding Zn-finger/Zn-ribbon topoisomerase 1